jgi:hypothetical protein
MAKINNVKLVKCAIKNLDEGEEFIAHFNPKEISWDKSVPWQQHKRSKGDAPLMEFTSAKPATLSCEFFFDTYEEKTSVDVFIGKLQKLTMVKKDEKDEKKRPPMVLFYWGTGFNKFKGVVESLSVKYTMFLPDGTPCRATATVKITQADKAKAKVRKKKKSSGSSTPSAANDLE